MNKLIGYRIGKMVARAIVLNDLNRWVRIEDEATKQLKIIRKKEIIWING